MFDFKGKQFLSEWPGGKDYKDFSLPDADETPANLLRPVPSRHPRAASLDAQMKVIEDAVELLPNGIRWVHAPGCLDAVAIKRECLPHLVEKQHREVWANYILPTLEDPLEVWLSPVKLRSSGKIVYRRRFIALFDDAGKTRATLAAAQENKDSSLLWNFIPSNDLKYIDRKRRGFLLYCKQAGR